MGWGSKFTLERLHAVEFTLQHSRMGKSQEVAKNQSAAGVGKEEAQHGGTMGYHDGDGTVPRTLMYSGLQLMTYPHRPVRCHTNTAVYDGGGWGQRWVFREYELHTQF